METHLRLFGPLHRPLRGAGFTLAMEPAAGGVRCSSLDYDGRAPLAAADAILFLSLFAVPQALK